MLGSCGIRRLDVQGVLVLFHSEINRCWSSLIEVLFCLFLIALIIFFALMMNFLFEQDAQSAINDMNGMSSSTSLGLSQYMYCC